MLNQQVKQTNPVLEGELGRYGEQETITVNSNLAGTRRHATVVLRRTEKKQKTIRFIL